MPFRPTTSPHSLPETPFPSRRSFLRTTVLGAGALGAAPLLAQLPGERPERDREITVLNPRCRVPVGIIIDDSTCLVNLNRFAMPQFDTAFAGASDAYHKNWREWPVEIPDRFVRKFADWALEHGVKGKYSLVPFPACVGRLDRMLPGWTQQELEASLRLVHEAITPNWDIHPEMVTHTRVIDTRTGHPYPQHSLKYMENWEWTTGRSVDELTDYLSYALRILREVGFKCEGVTTPGGFGNRVLPQLAQASGRSVRETCGAEIPHYFRHVIDKGDRSVAPRVEYASGLEGSDPRGVVSIIACTGDWTGGWDCSTPVGSDRFITADGGAGRLVEVIERGEPALLLAHWTGIYWNGQELGFEIFREVVKRLHARFDHLLWMKLSEVARYWAARELTRISASPASIALQAPFACPNFTLRFKTPGNGAPQLEHGSEQVVLNEVARPLQLTTNTWCRQGEDVVCCFSLPRGASRLQHRS